MLSDTLLQNYIIKVVFIVSILSFIFTYLYIYIYILSFSYIKKKKKKARTVEPGQIAKCPGINPNDCTGQCTKGQYKCSHGKKVYPFLSTRVENVLKK